MTDRLKEIIDRIAGISKDECLALISGAGDLAGEVGTLSIADCGAIIPELCKRWEIDESAIAGTKAAADNTAEEDTNALYEIVIKGLTDPSAKSTQAILFLKKSVLKDDTWSLNDIKDKFAAAEQTEFALPVAFPKDDKEFATLQEELKQRSVKFEVRKKK